MSRTAAIYLPPDALLSSVAAPTDLMQLANRFASERTGQPGDARTRHRIAPLACRWLSRHGQDEALSTGSRLPVDAGLDDATRYDAVFVAAFEARDDRDLIARLDAAQPLSEWLRRQQRQGALIAACGSAVFLLAEAGLLDGQQATAPWWQRELFHRRYPTVKLDVSQRITQSGHVLCAGSLAGLFPLALRFVQGIVSPNAADWLAKTTLIDGAADIDTPQPRAMRQAETHDPLVAAAQYQMQQRYAEKALLGALAQQQSISPRTLVRRFQRALGMSPQAYLQMLRIDAAQRMLTRTQLAVDRIGQQVGYSDGGFFKRVFRSHTGMSPAAWRTRVTTHVSDRQLQS